jgi:hypothetical protein
MPAFRPTPASNAIGCLFLLICTSTDHTFSTTMAKEILYIPEFRDELFESGLNLFDDKEEDLKKNWLTQGIVE